MGSIIYLALGRLELDWGKNSGFTDHSALFQEPDVADFPYFYAGGGELPEPTPDGKQWEVVTELKEGLSKPLPEVIDRMNLLGYSKRYAEAEFKQVMSMGDSESSGLTFELLHKALKEVELDKVSLDYGEGGEDFGKFFRREISPRLRLREIVGEDLDEWSVGYAMENLSPYAVMQLLADNPRARELPVNWQFNDVAENGWAKRSEFVCPLAPSNRFLIVTEGSSDAYVLRHAFRLLRPHIADFFHYVDMQEGYPFTGTGSVFRFVQGLISIAVQNNIVVLYDNDAEGCAGFARTQELNIPENMRVLRLPDMPRFKMFKTTGPSGKSTSDINGKAAAIECYLDLHESPLVRWSSYNAKQDTYQGELVNKDDYTKEFLRQRERVDGYDYSGIEAVLDMLIDACGAMKEATQLSSIDFGDG